MAYPSTLSAVTGNTLVSDADHAAIHNAIETTVGTTAGTNVLKNFAAGDFPARINASNILQQRVSGTVDTAVLGTPSITAGNLTTVTLGTSTFIGGTIGTALVGTSTIQGGTIANALVGTSTIIGGTVGTALIGTSTFQGGTISGGTITSFIGTSTIIGGTIGTALIGTSTITGGTANSQLINTPDIRGFYTTPGATTVAAGGTATLDLNTSNEWRVTFGTGNATLAVNNAINGKKFLVSLTQDAVGTRTVTWFSTIKWVAAGTPTLTVTASKRDTFGFVCTGTATYDGFIVGQNI